MTEEWLQQMEIHATGTSSHEWHIRLLVAEVRRRNQEAGIWQGAWQLALEQAAVAEKQRDAARTAIRKALHSGQVGQDAAAMLLEALGR